MGWFTPAKKAGFRVILSDDDPPLWDRKIRASRVTSAKRHIGESIRDSF